MSGVFLSPELGTNYDRLVTDVSVIDYLDQLMAGEIHPSEATGYVFGDYEGFRQRRFDPNAEYDARDFDSLFRNATAVNEEAKKLEGTSMISEI